MASITTITNKDGGLSYRVNWRVGEGKDRRPETKTFSTQKEARAFRNLKDGEEQRRLGSARRIPVFAYLDEWLAARKSDRKNPLRATTIESYERNIGIFKRGLKRDRLLSQLDKPHIDAAYDELLANGKLLTNREAGKTGPLAKRTVLHVHRMLHKALHDAKRNKLISINPAVDADAPQAQGKKYKTPVRPFTKNEVLTMLARAQDPLCDPETHPMAACLAVTGMRRGELAGLADDAMDWGDGTGGGAISVFRTVVDIDGDLKVEETPKTEAGIRTITIPRELVALLRAQRARVLEVALAWGKGYQREPLYLFPSPDGTPMHPKLITKRMTRLIKRAGIVAGKGKKISPVHSWRHTTGTLLWQTFKDPKQIQARLGHSTPAISMELYVASTAEADDEAAHVLGGLIR